MGIEMSGMSMMYFRIFLMVTLELVVVVFIKLSKLTRPPKIGSMLHGSGELKSRNQRKPSVSIAGEMS